MISTEAKPLVLNWRKFEFKALFFFTKVSFQNFYYDNSAGLSMGSSKPWPEVMRVITGQEKMDAYAIREYFKPLEKWLTAANQEMGEIPGWK